jgi:hypothetical protein
MKIKTLILKRNSMLSTKLLLHDQCIDHMLIVKIEKHKATIKKTLNKLT